MFNSLFSNVGSKLQTYAKVIAIIEMVAFFIIGIVAMTKSFWVGLLYWIIGALVAVISSWFLIGFGIIVEASEKQLGKDSTSNE